MFSVRKYMIKVQSSAKIPTIHGELIMSAFAEDENEKQPNLAIYHPDMDVNEPVLVRVHSECLTGDIFHSLKCDCGDQLNRSLQLTQKEKGLLIYLRQEGRGIGLIEKLKAYQLQDQGLDTVEANIHLGHEVDSREYSVAADILNHFSIARIRLLTNNPDKVNDLENHGLEVVERVPLVIPANPENQSYLDTKKQILGHKL